MRENHILNKPPFYISEGTGPRRQRKKPPPPESPEQNPDDIVDIRFVGGNIPSRSFRMLQKSMPGDPSKFFLNFS